MFGVSVFAFETLNHLNFCANRYLSILRGVWCHGADRQLCDEGGAASSVAGCVQAQETRTESKSSRLWCCLGVG